MYTKEELDGAVRNFNLCPEADKPTLVNTIKARIEALDLKVAFKGQLMRHFDVRKYPVAEATTIYEASNVGTLEPIVGAVPTKHKYYVNQSQQKNSIHWMMPINSSLW